MTQKVKGTNYSEPISWELLKLHHAYPCISQLHLLQICIQFTTIDLTSYVQIALFLIFLLTTLAHLPIS